MAHLGFYMETSCFEFASLGLGVAGMLLGVGAPIVGAGAVGWASYLGGGIAQQAVAGIAVAGLGEAADMVHPGSGTTVRIGAN